MGGQFELTQAAGVKNVVMVYFRSGMTMVFGNHTVQQLVSAMRVTRLSRVMVTGLCSMMVLGIVPSAAPWLARESLFEFTAREPKNQDPVEPGPTTEEDPATPVGDSGLT